MISKKWLQRICLTVFCLVVTAGWGSVLWAAESEPLTVTIEQAEKTEYVKDQNSGEEVIRFTGDVSLTVDNQGTKTVIQAETVVFNRERATVYASGDVQFTQTGEGKNTETLTAQSLLFNTRTLEGVFDDGRVVQESSGNINLPTGSVLVVYADTFGRENGGTVTFKDGSLTFCDDPDPHWKINASRIWLLPGNEFAIFNGFMYVGHFPVLYIPFFYYPKDEMVFNPSFGYDGRKGYFTQTTTYLIGRKGLSESSTSSSDDEGLFSFMKTTSLKEQVREGLFLHNLDTDAVMPDNTTKILLDAYSNLGYMAGVEGTVKSVSNFSDLSFGTYLGVSHTLFPVTSYYGSYTTLSPTDQQYWDSGWFLGKQTPVRFGANFKATYSRKPFSLNLSLPVYSDPFFTSDFLSDRKESMDWINFLMNNIATGGNLSAAETASSTTLSNYTWSVSGSVSSPDFVSNLNPWVSEIALSSFSSQINFASKTNSTLTGETASYDPNRYFYYPSAVYPFKANMRISGKLLSLGSSTPGNTTGSIAGLEMPEPADEPAVAEQAPASGTDAASLTLLPPPSLKTSSLSSVTLQGFKMDVTYSITPAVSTEVNYDASSFNGPEDIAWNDFKNRYLQLKCPVTVKSNSSWRGGFIGLTNTLEFLPVYQEHTDVSESFYTETALQQLKEADFKARTLNLNNTNSLSMKPFQYVDWLSGSSISWNTGLKLIRTEFTGTVDDPSWTYRKAGWDKDSFTAHNITGVLAATQYSSRYKESLTVKMNLPPLNRRYEAIATVSFPTCNSLSASTAYRLTDDGVWVHEPFNQSSSWSFFQKSLGVTQSYRYNIEDAHNESLSLAATGYGASVTYNMLYTTPYEYVSGNGWVAESEKEFLPYSINMRYVMPQVTWTRLNDAVTMKPSVTSNMAMDLIRPTQSTFSITSGLTFKITDFLDVTIAAESQNKVMYRYVQRYFGSGITLPGEENMIRDLFDSFAFWNPVARQNSGFKLRSFSVKLDHNLHDWTLHSEFKVSPRLVKDSSGISEYDYAPYFILSIKWNPMSSLKTSIQDNYGEFVLNPSEE